MLTSKQVLGTNLGKGDQNRGFWSEIGWVSKRKPKNWASCSGAARLTSSWHVVASCLVQHPMLWVFRVLGGRSRLS